MHDLVLDTGTKSFSLEDRSVAAVNGLPFQPHEGTIVIDAPKQIVTADGFWIALMRLIIHTGAWRYSFFAVFLSVFSCKNEDLAGMINPLRRLVTDEPGDASATRLRANVICTENALRIAGFDDCISGNAEVLMSQYAILALLRLSHDHFESSSKH